MGFWTFVFAISALSIVAGLVNNWMKVRHGYPIHGYPIEEEGEPLPARKRQMDAICAENQQLKSTIAKLEDRLKVLERIATDSSRRLSDEIDELH